MLLSGIIVGFWIVRSLGPQQYGAFSVALSVTAVFAALSAAGLETVVIRRLCSGNHPVGSVVVTAIALRLAGSALYILVCVGAATILLPDYAGVVMMTAVISAAAFFRAADVVGLWLQVENRYGTAARTRIAVRIAGDAVRVLFILQGASAIWFAFAIVVEAVIGCAAFLVIGRSVLRQRVRIDQPLARSLLADGVPVMGSAILAALYARIDQLVLFNLYGAVDNGYYAASARISEAFNVVLLSVGTVAAAHFGRLASAPDHEVRQELKVYFRSMALLGCALAALLSIFARPIVQLVYGEEFQPSVDILRVHAWTFALVSASVGLEPWFYHYRKLHYYVPKTLFTLIFALPAVLLGTYWQGPVGTAAAVVATYFVSVFATNLLLPGLRDAFRFQMEALSAGGPLKK